MAILKLTIEIPVSDVDGALFYGRSTAALAGDTSCLIGVESALRNISRNADFQVIETSAELHEGFKCYIAKLLAKPKL